MSEIRNLNPQSVFGYFDDICSIPHGSGNMAGINQYLIDFAVEHGYEYHTDEVKNVVIIREASEGYEDEPALMMQAHVDMVCAKVEGKEIDFIHEPITPYIDGAYIKADGTTLGADDGIGAAMILAILADKELPHPRIEGIFTTDEETSMAGAFGLDISYLQGHRLLNLDSEEEGIFTVSSAGAVNVETSLPIVRDNAPGNVFKIIVHGGIGGHSGAEIHRGRSNANVLLGRALKHMAKMDNIRLVSVMAGKAHNVINNYAEAIVVADCDYNKFDRDLSELESIVRAEYKSTDPDILLDSVQLGESPEPAMDKATSKTVIDYMFGAMDGIQYMSFDMEDLVETSMNFAIISTEDDTFKTVTSIRSCVTSRLELIKEKLYNRAENYGMTYRAYDGYPGWEFVKESAMRELCVSTWTELYGVIPQIVALHAGLECGIFIGKSPEIDAIAVGPSQYDVHSPNESVDIASVERVYAFVQKVVSKKVQ